MGRIDQEIEQQMMILEKLRSERDRPLREQEKLAAGMAGAVGLQRANKRIDQWRSPDYVRNVVSYHSPTAESLARIGAVRTATEMFIRAIAEQCPDNADRAAAIRHAREAMMTANASIVLEDLA